MDVFGWCRKGCQERTSDAKWFGIMECLTCATADQRRWVLSTRYVYRRARGSNPPNRIHGSIRVHNTGSVRVQYIYSYSRCTTDHIEEHSRRALCRFRLLTRHLLAFYSIPIPSFPTALEHLCYIIFLSSTTARYHSLVVTFINTHFGFFYVDANFIVQR